jgi:putative acetyltransferase
MRTAAPFLRRGVGSAVLEHLIHVATNRGYLRLSLETGIEPAFEPARALYARRGFVPCGPFGSYAADPNSCFLTLALP